MGAPAGAYARFAAWCTGLAWARPERGDAWRRPKNRETLGGSHTVRAGLAAATPPSLDAAHPQRLSLGPWGDARRPAPAWETFLPAPPPHAALAAAPAGTRAPATCGGAPPPGPRRASGVHAARWGASQAGIAPSHAPPRRAPQGAERWLALRPAAAGAIGEPQPALGPQGVLAEVALGASRRCAPWDALGTRPGRAADGEERPGPGLPARGYDDKAQGASNLSPSPLLKHYPRNLQAQPGTVGILRLEEGHRADVTIYDLKTLQPYPALTIRLQ